MLKVQKLSNVYSVGKIWDLDFREVLKLDSCYFGQLQILLVEISKSLESI